MSEADLLELHGEEWSLVLEQGDRAVPVWRHLGARVDAGSLPRLADLRGPATFSLEGDHAMDALPMGGLGWFGPSAVALRDTAVVFDSCGVERGEESLTLTCRDSVNAIEVAQLFRKLESGGLEVSVSLTNLSNATVILDCCASAILPLAATSRAIVSWRGRHNAEFVECREAMPEHAWVRETRRGLPGHGGPCGAYVLGEDTGWHSALAVAM